MNSRAKLLCVFFLITICLSFSTLLGAFAETVPEDTPSTVTAVDENTSSRGNSVPSGTAVSSRANSSAALSSRASSSPPKSSVSSKKRESAVKYLRLPCHPRYLRWTCSAFCRRREHPIQTLFRCRKSAVSQSAIPSAQRQPGRGICSGPTWSASFRGSASAWVSSLC